MEEYNIEHTCCFFGHRKISDSKELRAKLWSAIETLIINHSVDTFLFGSKSDFDTLCCKTVTALKESYPYIKQIYVRAEYPHITDSYYDYLLAQGYDDTYFPEHLEHAGKSSYIKRNHEMIHKSKFCIVYYNENYLPPRRKYNKRNVADYQPKSGTALAYHYAMRKKREIMNVGDKML